MDTIALGIALSNKQEIDILKTQVVTNHPFNPNWVTNGTIAQFCASVDADADATAGMSYLGELTCSDLPFSGNADAVVEIIDGSGTSGKVIHVRLTSGNVAPYRWEYTYWNSGANVSGWIPNLYAPPYPQENGTYEIVMTKTNAGVSFNWATASSEEQVYGEIINDTYGGT